MNKEVRAFAEKIAEAASASVCYASCHAHLKEHRHILGGITVHPKGEILELSSLLGLFGIFCRIMDRSCKDAATLMYRGHRSQAQ